MGWFGNKADLPGFDSTTSGQGWGFGPAPLFSGARPPEIRAPSRPSPNVSSFSAGTFMPRGTAAAIVRPEERGTAAEGVEYSESTSPTAFQ